MIRQIKTGMLVSYDYEYLKNSLPLVYEHSYKIVLAADKEGKTWAGNILNIPDTFWQWIKDFDTQHKIEIYKDAFYVEGLTSMQCETRERNMLAQRMGEGGWHLQIDADEYFADFENLVEFLRRLDEKASHINCVSMQVVTLYKKLPTGYLIVKNGGTLQFATTRPQYYLARMIEYPVNILYPQKVVHDSWARTEHDLWTKLKNWGHNSDFDIDEYFRFWKWINETNYTHVQDFHPLAPEVWHELDYIEALNIPDLLRRLKREKIKREFCRTPIP
jgi:hypothetical protein